MVFFNHILCCFCGWDSSTFWDALTAIFTLITTIIAAIGATRGIQYYAWVKAQEIFTADEFVEARQIVYALEKDVFSNWKNDEVKVKAAKRVCRKMDELAWLAPYLGEQKILEVWGHPYAKAWRVLKNLIDDEQKKAGWSKWHAFQKMGKKAAERIEKQTNK